MQSSSRRRGQPTGVGPVEADARTVDESATLTVDELAREAGMTVRNVRAHQSRGLLPPPEVRGRTGYYGPEHVGRLRLIAELQGEGFNLTAIQRVLERVPPGAATSTFEFGLEVRSGWDEEPQVITREQLAERFGADDQAVTERSVKLGILIPLGGDRFEVPSPMLLEVGEELVAMGVPMPAVLDVAERITKHGDGIAKSFVDLFIREVWKPFDDAGRPEARWHEVAEALERARPLALKAVEAIMRRSLARQSDAAFTRLLKD